MHAYEAGRRLTERPIQIELIPRCVTQFVCPGFLWKVWWMIEEPIACFWQVPRAPLFRAGVSKRILTRPEGDIAPMDGQLLVGGIGHRNWFNVIYNSKDWISQRSWSIPIRISSLFDDTVKAVRGEKDISPICTFPRKYHCHIGGIVGANWLRCVALHSHTQCHTPWRGCGCPKKGCFQKLFMLMNAVLFNNSYIHEITRHKSAFLHRKWCVVGMVNLFPIRTKPRRTGGHCGNVKCGLNVCLLLVAIQLRETIYDASVNSSAQLSYVSRSNRPAFTLCMSPLNDTSISLNLRVPFFPFIKSRRKRGRHDRLNAVEKIDILSSLISKEDKFGIRYRIRNPAAAVITLHR